MPFYVSSAGYGVLIDAARYVTVYAGTAVRRDSKHPPVVRDRNLDRRWSSQPTSDAVEVLVPAAGATIYVFAGPTPLDAVRRYNLYSGGGVLPPKWGLGFLHRVPTLFTAQQAADEVAQFASRGYPLDVLGLEPGWQSASYPGTFVWDRTRFPDPDAFLAGMKRAGVRVNLWMNPYVAPSSPLYASFAPRSGSHTVWTGIVPDITLPAVRTQLLEHFDRELVSRGVSGYKVDETDGYDRWLWPDHATFPSGLSGEQMRQVYGLAFQRATLDAFRARDQRTYGLVRASNAGAAPFPYVLYNDSYGHQEFITALASSGFIGVLWTPEVRSSRTGEEWLRRMQSVCFSPLAMLNAWSDGTKPWSFPEVADQVREVDAAPRQAPAVSLHGVRALPLRRRPAGARHGARAGLPRRATGDARHGQLHRKSVRGRHAARRARSVHARRRAARRTDVRRRHGAHASCCRAGAGTTSTRGRSPARVR